MNYRRLSKWLSVACMLLCFTSVQAESFFGIEVGGRFAIRECSREDFNPSVNATGEGLCSIPGTDIQHPWGSVTHSVVFPANMESHGIKHIYVDEYNDSVVRIGAVTYGEPSQEEVFQDLVKKFGKPTSVNNAVLQNAFNAKFQSISARWVAPGYTVTFKGIEGDRLSGEIELQTKEGLAEAKVADQWRATHQPNAM